MKRLDHLRDIDEVTRKTLPLPQLLQAVLEQVSNYFKVDTLSMLLVEDDCLRVSAALGVVADEVRQGFRIRLGSGFESKLLASEGPLILDNLENEEVLSPTLRAAQVHSILGAPLVVGERHIGIIHLGLASPRKFTQDEVELIQRVADRVALAVAHARAIDQLQRANERWRVLHALAADLSRGATAREVVATFVRHLHGAAANTAASVVYLAEGDSLRLAAQRGLSLKALRKLEKLDRNSRRMPLTEAFYSRQPLWLSDPAAIASAFPNLTRTTIAPEEFQACLAIPLVAEGEPVGAFAMSFRKPRAFDSAARFFFESVARECAFALARARLLDESAKKSQAKDEFLAMLGHELRNPLAPIVTALRLISLKGNDRSREHQIIERQVAQLMRLVDDLLDVSRIARGKVEMRRDLLEVSKIVANAAEVAGPLIEERRHQLTLEVEEGLTVTGDAARLQQVIANLLTNAAKYTDPGGSIAVRAARSGEQAMIRVEDNGIGIPASVLPHVFERFYQGPRDPSRAQGGLGLGLAIVRNIVRLHGGEVVARSAGPGKGSEFVVRLPAMTAHTALSSQPQPTPSITSPIEGRRVLLVDDNADAVDSLADMLRSFGHEVRVAYNGPEALRALNDFQPQVAVLDIGLPVMDGVELATRLRDRVGSALRVFALTGYGRPEDHARTAQNGFEHHFVKPVDPAVLARSISAPAPGRSVFQAGAEGLEGGTGDAPPQSVPNYN
jgi:signal transduction histidine kinase/CheY-like chemotaxis protein/putative methionine-R-sulfoxide reductase with GAF domain